MEKKRKFILIVAVVGMIGTFLPWASAFGISVSGTEGDGWITLILFAIGGALAFFSGDKAQPLTKGKLTGVWLPSALAAVIALRKILDKPQGISIGIGLWLIAIAGIVQVLLTFFFKGDKGWDLPKPAAEEKAPAAPPPAPAEPAPPAEPAAPAAPEPPASEPEPPEEEKE